MKIKCHICNFHTMHVTLSLLLDALITAQGFADDLFPICIIQFKWTWTKTYLQNFFLENHKLCKHWNAFRGVYRIVGVKSHWWIEPLTLKLNWAFSETFNRLHHNSKLLFILATTKKSTTKTKYDNYLEQNSKFRRGRGMRESGVRVRTKKMVVAVQFSMRCRHFQQHAKIKIGRFVFYFS